jgi:hypothetical protein
MLNISIIRKNLINRIVLLIAIVALTASFRHPIKLTASLIEYSPKTNCLKMECKIFIDDFEKSINKTLAKNIDTSNPSKEDINGIDDYINSYINLSLNNKTLNIKYKTSEIVKTYNVLLIKFEDINVKLKKGDKLLIENALFFEEFGYAQSNRITIRIPPFIAEDHYETTLDNYSFLLNL